jgi:glycerate 2-kinase
VPTFDFTNHREYIETIVNAALEASDPAKALLRHWQEAPLDTLERCYIVGAGKASLEMALAFREHYRGRIIMGGAVAVVPERLARLSEMPLEFQLYPAAHPLPDERNLIAASAIRDAVQQAGPSDTVICLLSGGGSAHLSLPVPSLSLDDLRYITSALMRAGAPIQELNTVRKHCEVLKGGGLVRLAAPAAVCAFILSDVIGDRLDIIASGPTAPDRSTFEDALHILKTYNLLDEVPSVSRWLAAGARGEHPETLKDSDSALQGIQNIVIGSNGLALDAVGEHLQAQGWAVAGREYGVEGEASQVGKRIGQIALELSQQSKEPCAWLFGGETTVTVRGGGRGGRNQEMALSAALVLQDTPNIVVATFSTDGIDGPTDAAGAIVTDHTWLQAQASGIDLESYLRRNDSYTLFDCIGGLIRTGPTGTNVNDIAVILAY